MGVLPLDQTTLTLGLLSSHVNVTSEPSLLMVTSSSSLTMLTISSTKVTIVHLLKKQVQ